MSASRLPCISLASALCLLAGATVAGAAAASPPVGDEGRAQAQYQRDRAACAKITVRDDHENCLSEASTAYAAARPAVVDPDPGRYERNAMLRCDPLPAAERPDCQARMQGAGTTSGSVAGGGIYRELVTRTPGGPASAPAMPAPLSQ